MSSHPAPGRSHIPARRLIIPAIVLAAVFKLYLAGSLELFQDEAFYWLESRHLAPSYSDIPPLTAVAIRAGTELLGDNVLGVRAVFWLAGALMPLLVVWLARPLAGPRDAWLAAGCALLLPLLAVAVGSIAVADSLMIPLSLVFFGAFERATRTGEAKWWWLSGMALALGFLCHYRFAAVAFAGIVYLFFSREGRRQLGTPGPWLAAGLGALGLLPILWFSFAQEHQALQFQFVDRHPWHFDIGGLRFVLSQALLATPLLFGFLVAAWISLGRSARRGDDRRLLLWLFATFAAGIYFALSPFMGQQFATFHWPLAGYLPLLVFLPELLRSAKRWLAGATIALAVILCLASGGLLALQTQTDALHRKLPALIFRSNTNFTGWQAMAARAGEWLERLDGVELLVGDHYVTAAQLAFYTGRAVYTTEPWKLANDGRAPQMRLWDLDEAGLAGRAGEDALVVYMASERKRYTPDRHRAALERMCRMFETVEHLDRLNLWGGVKVFDFYLAKNVGGGPARQCPAPDAPAATREKAPVSTTFAVPGNTAAPS